MQSLNSTCQEADYLLGDGFCTFKKPALKPQSKLLVKRYSNVSSLPPPSIPSSSSSQSSSLYQQQTSSSSSLYGSSSSKSSTHSSRSSTSSKNGKKGGSSSGIVGGSPPKKSKFSSSTSTSATLPLYSSSASSSTNGGGSSSSTQTSTPSYDIYDRLKTLHLELLREDNSLKNMLSLRSTSFLLEKLIAKDKLNSLILNLYPGNKGYSLAFRLDKKTTELTNSQDNPSGGSSSNTLINNKNTSKTGAASLSSSSSSNNKLNSNSNVNISNNENLQETMRWPYEDEDLLESIDNEELPLILVDIIEKKCPHLFYSGCVIAEIRDYRQSFPIYTCDTSHVLLKPTNQTLFADVNLITSEGNWSSEDKLRLESQLVLATAQPLCLDPNPNIGILSINHQHTRNLLNTPSIRRQSKKCSQVAINRKRKLDQFTHNYGLELSDFMQKYRKRASSKPTSTGATNIGTTNNYPKKSSDILPIRTPNLDLPASLTIPEEINVEKFAKTFERPRETKDCQPQLIEQYILETDRADKQTYHIKLSLYQRPSNYEFLGELYVDKNHRDGERNGEACQFSLGTRAHANRYIQQFTEIFTEEGRKSVKITHYIPGQPPRISCTARMWEHRIQQQAAIQQQQQLQQQQVIQQLNPIQPQLNNTTPTPQQIISAGPSTNVINVRQTPQPQVNPPMYQNCTTQVIQPQPHQQQQQQQPQPVQQLQQNTQITSASGSQLAQLNLTNNRPVLLVKPSSANITNLTINTQTNQQARSNMGTPVPVLQAQLQSHTIQSPQQIQQIQQQTPELLTPTIHSTNPEINALATGLMNSANQFQQRFAAAKSRQQQQQQQQQQQRQQQNSGGSSNAAIISLLNSAPAAMTNSPVLSNNQVAVDNLMARKPTVENTILQTQQLPQKLFSTTTGNPTSVRKLSTSLQATQQQQQAGLSRIFNHSNLIAVSSVGNQTQLINVQQQPDGSYQQTGNDRVSLSALASQLASPPAVMTSPIIQQTQTVQNNQNYSVNNFPQQGSITKQVLINSVNPRLLATQGGNTLLHRESSVTSPGSDSNASSSSTIGYSMSGLNALLTTSPSPVSFDLNSNNSNSALIERLTSPSSTISGQFTAPSPKNINIQQQSQQHIQVQSPASISPMSSPPPPQHQQPQTTTLNLQGLNLASLQGAISTIPGLQNVQVQIPGISQPISLSLSGPTNTNASLNAQPTSLLVSVPVTNTTQVNQIQSIPSSGATQTVVLTNAQPGAGGGSNLLSLPIAQFVTTSNVKGLNQQTIRTTNSGNQPFQLVGTIQRPRGIQVAGSSLVNSKQLSARALIATPQRGSALKITTPINATSSQLQTNLHGNHIVMSTAQQQHQMKLQKQLQQQCNNTTGAGMPQIIAKSHVGPLNASNPGSNVGAINVNSVITAALQGNHRRRSGTETNK